MTRSHPRSLATLLSLFAFTGGAMVCAAQQPYGAPATGATMRASSGDSTLIAALIVADRSEIAYSRSALPVLKDAELKRLAQKIVEEHTTHEAATTHLAARLMIPSPSSSPAMEPAPTSDAQYVAALVTHHQQLLASLPADASTIQDPGLRDHVAATRQAVQMHLDQATKIQARLAGRAP